MHSVLIVGIFLLCFQTGLKFLLFPDPVSMCSVHDLLNAVSISLYSKSGFYVFWFKNRYHSVLIPDPVFVSFVSRPGIYMFFIKTQYLFLLFSDSVFINLLWFQERYLYVLNLLALFPDSASAGCRDGFVQVKDWCFSFNLRPTGLLDTMNQCESQGAGLVTLDSAEKERALTQFIEGQWLYQYV